MKDYQGYMIESSNLKEVNMILSQARKRVMEAQKEEFHRLLAEEITTIVDAVSYTHLDVYKRQDWRSCCRAEYG